MNKIQIVNQLNERKKTYSFCLEHKIIEYASMIVEVGALTVGTDKNGKIIAQNVLHPTQFSKTAVNTILSMKWKDGNDNEIIPKVFNRNDWYLQKIKLIQETLSLLN